MPYCTKSDILASLESTFAAQLADDAHGASINAGDYIDEEGASQTLDVLGQIIEDADSMCDSYLGARYIVPITTVPAALRRTSCAIAIYYLHLRRSWTVTPEIKSAFDDAIKWLKDVRSGVGEISTAAAPIAQPAGKTSSFSGDTRIFTTSTLEGFI